MKILMVCLGNICRSPLAEGIMKNKIRKIGLNWFVDSAGTGAWHIGERPDYRSIAIAKKYGIDISDQRARKITPDDIQHFDLILAMDISNLRDILNHCKNEEQRSKVQLIMKYVLPDKEVSVPDPYWNDDGFEKVFNMLDLACDKIIAQLTKTNQNKILL